MRCFLGFLGLSLLVGCTGFSLGENDPNTNLGTYLGSGAIAVDPKTETAFVLVSEEDVAEGTSQRELFAVKADDTVAHRVLTLDGREDPRILFTDVGALVMSQRHDDEHLAMLDRETFEVIGRKEIPVWYWGTRQSASRRWIGVADNEGPGADIHVIDAHTLEPRVIPHGGDWIEAMFTNKSDRLVAVTFDTKKGSGRLLSWSMDQLASDGFATKSASAPWDGHDLDVPLGGVLPDQFFSFTWVGISPDDRLAVVPVRKATPGSDWSNVPIEDYELLVTELATGDVRVVPRAKGPVGFSPDGSTIVSYTDSADGAGQDLLLIDAETLETETVDLHSDAGLHFFVSHRGNTVVVAGADAGHLVMVDLDDGGQTTMRGPSAPLDEFVVRDRKQARLGYKSPEKSMSDTAEELYLVSTRYDAELAPIGGDLVMADLLRGETVNIPLPFEAAHIAILPNNDQLVLGDLEGRTLHFLDPKSHSVLRDVRLPVTF